eukprot:365691-Chlamydomonas_euryale.AAC.1
MNTAARYQQRAFPEEQYLGGAGYVPTCSHSNTPHTRASKEQRVHVHCRQLLHASAEHYIKAGLHFATAVDRQ